VHHRAVPLEDAHALIEQRAIERALNLHRPADVAVLREQEPDIDAVARRLLQGEHVRPMADEIGVGDPEALPRHRATSKSTRSIEAENGSV
jgi:hypothetical protein